MKNLWVQRRAEIASWSGDLSAIAAKPEAVMTLLLQIVDLGVATGIVVVEADAARAMIEDHWAKEHRIDARVLANHNPRARLCWYDSNDALASGLVDDTGRLLRSLVPGKSIDRYVADLGSPPLAVTGSIFRYQDGQLVQNLGGQVVLFTTYTDIWFPFVTGAAHPSWDSERFFDNRELASWHTPRLNAYLEAVASAVIAAGGRWEIEHACVARQLSPWVTERGILLDGPVPPLMPPELVDVPWPSLDE